jgi:hypothetical protein
VTRGNTRRSVRVLVIILRDGVWALILRQLSWSEGRGEDWRNFISKKDMLDSRIEINFSLTSGIRYSN